MLQVFQFYQVEGEISPLYYIKIFLYIFISCAAGLKLYYFLFIYFLIFCLSLQVVEKNYSKLWFWLQCRLGPALMHLL